MLNHYLKDPSAVPPQNSSGLFSFDRWMITSLVLRIPPDPTQTLDFLLRFRLFCYCRFNHPIRFIDTSIFKINQDSAVQLEIPENILEGGGLSVQHLGRLLRYMFMKSLAAASSIRSRISKLLRQPMRVA